MLCATTALTIDDRNAIKMLELVCNAEFNNPHIKRLQLKILKQAAM